MKAQPAVAARRRLLTGGDSPLLRASLKRMKYGVRLTAGRIASRAKLGCRIRQLRVPSRTRLGMRVIEDPPRRRQE